MPDHVAPTTIQQVFFALCVVSAGFLAVLVLFALLAKAKAVYTLFVAFLLVVIAAYMAHREILS